MTTHSPISLASREGRGLHREATVALQREAAVRRVEAPEAPPAEQADQSALPVVAVIGLGYVGLPLVVEFGKLTRAIGFDVLEHKVAKCRTGIDPSREIPDAEMRRAEGAVYTSDATLLGEADFILVAVPTPVDKAHIPDFEPLLRASETIGAHMKRGATIVFESTVYPGATEEVCIPALERASGRVWKRDFFVGYSPERINPGDRQYVLTNVVKVVAGDTPETLERVARLYERVVQPGVHRCSSIKVAEASKVIENTQRDLNIALMNELAIIFEKLAIDTSEVLRAAGTKWNFLHFKPGLVGGHCIGVDPYYLTHKAEMLGYHPQVITAGRRINDGMGKYVAEQTVKQIIASGGYVKGARINILGLTFKEDCADVRNSKVVDIVEELRSYGAQVYLHDPEADPQAVLADLGLQMCAWDDLPRADAIVAAVAHRKYRELTAEDFSRKVIRNGCFIDVKAAYDAEPLRQCGLHVWRL